MNDFGGVPGPAHVHFPREGSQKSRVSQIGVELHFGAILGSILVPFGGLGGPQEDPKAPLGQGRIWDRFLSFFRALPGIGESGPGVVTCRLGGLPVH